MAHPRQYRFQGDCSPTLSCDLDNIFAKYQHGVSEPSFTEAMLHLQSHVPGFLGSQYAAETLDEAQQLKVGRLKGDPLKAEHIAVIREWTKERSPTSMYKEITRTTWQRGSQPMEPVVPLEYKLMSALKGAPGASGLNVTRVINADVGSKYKEGEEFCFWAPTSTTLAPDSEILSKFGGDGSIAIFHLKLAPCTAGRVISHYSYFQDEQEVLLLPGVKFKVSSVFTKDGLTTITAEEIPPASCVRHLHAEQPLRVLVVGECGDGKSTLLNNVLGLDGEAAASAGLKTGGITKNITEYFSDQNIGGKPLVVLDSPGVGDEDVTAMELLSMIEEHLSSLDGEVLDCVIVTCPSGDGRVRLGAQVVKALVDKGFVGAEKWQNVILVGTKMDKATALERTFFLKDVAASFFSACKGTRGRAVLTSLTDVSQLLEALKVLPRSKVQYEKPDPEIMSEALAKQLGINEEVFQEKLIEERTRRELAVLAEQEAKAAAEEDRRLRAQAELEEQKAKAAAEEERRLKEQAVLEEQKAKAAAEEERRLKEQAVLDKQKAKAAAAEERRLKDAAVLQEQRAKAKAEEERVAAQRERELREAEEERSRQRERKWKQDADRRQADEDQRKQEDADLQEANAKKVADLQKKIANMKPTPSPARKPKSRTPSPRRKKASPPRRKTPSPPRRKTPPPPSSVQPQRVPSPRSRAVTIKDCDNGSIKTIRNSVFVANSSTLSITGRWVNSSTFVCDLEGGKWIGKFVSGGAYTGWNGARSMTDTEVLNHPCQHWEPFV